MCFSVLPWSEFNLSISTNPSSKDILYCILNYIFFFSFYKAAYVVLVCIFLLWEWKTQPFMYVLKSDGLLLRCHIPSGMAATKSLQAPLYLLINTLTLPHYTILPYICIPLYPFSPPHSWYASPPPSPTSFSYIFLFTIVLLTLSHCTPVHCGFMYTQKIKCLALSCIAAKFRSHAIELLRPSTPAAWPANCLPHWAWSTFLPGLC